jgi:hypothetical protein
VVGVVVGVGVGVVVKGGFYDFREYYFAHLCCL